MGEGDKPVEERSPEGHHRLGNSLSCELLGPGRRAVGTREVLALASVFPRLLVRTTCRKAGGLYGCLVEPLQLSSLYFLCSYVYYP